MRGINLAPFVPRGSGDPESKTPENAVLGSRLRGNERGWSVYYRLAAFCFGVTWMMRLVALW